MNNRMAASNDIFMLYENMCPHVSHMSRALRRLAFLHDMSRRHMSDMSASRFTRRTPRPLVLNLTHMVYKKQKLEYPKQG